MKKKVAKKNNTDGKRDGIIQVAISDQEKRCLYLLYFYSHDLFVCVAAATLPSGLRDREGQ